MTTWIGKVLTVFITMASVGFMAVIAANVLAGGPNWKAKSAELSEVDFAQTGPDPKSPWTAKRRTNGEDLQGGAILPAAIVKAQQNLLKYETDEQARLDPLIVELKEKISTNKALNQLDIEAMKRRQADLAARYSQKEAEFVKLASEMTAKIELLTKTTTTTNIRNEESIRYKHQIEELIVEREQIEEEVRRLRDLVFQANANLERVKTRQSVLAKDGAKPYDKAASGN